ncbi:MAG: outer membrane lipoprotein-sorting protein [Chloroflexota bacterium]|nr:outer membrane lipoprotein-sorting protein [Chloroflexota bacterium]MDQ5866951.1 outer membrane lipoprotein-sorting protein [Chloroflexota bacterium]
MSKEFVKSVLIEDADRHVPAQANLWPAMHERLRQTTYTVRQEKRPPFRLNPFALGVALTVVVLVLGLVASTSLSFTQPTPVSAAELLTRVEAAADSNAARLNSFHGVVSGEQRNSGSQEFSQVREEHWYLAPGNSRMESHITGGNGEVNVFMWVTNGKTGWSYDPYFGKAMPLTGKDLKGRFGAASLNDLLNRRMLKGFYNTEVKGTEQVAGRTAYILESTLKPAGEWPPGTSPSEVARIMAWVDAEAFFVLRLEAWDSAGNLLSRSAYESFELNGAVDPAMFDAPPPTPTR